MSKKTTYEIITGKLEQVPLPDMRDAIWSRIEEQLDADLPTDEGPSPDAPTSPDWVRLLTRFGLSAVVIGFITVFLLTKTNSTPTATFPKDNVTTVEDIQIPDTQTRAPVYEDAINYSVLKKEAPPDAGNIPPPLLSLPLQDSVATEPLVISPTAPLDSTLSTSPFVTEMVQSVRQDTVQKKPRGVQGIKDSDYRIVPKKDSIP